MKRYFFDLADKSHVEYDYRGREFKMAEDARALAELIALDLECSAEGVWSGAEVRVLNAGGDRLFSIPVRALDNIAV